MATDLLTTTHKYQPVAQCDRDRYIEGGTDDTNRWLLFKHKYANNSRFKFVINTLIATLVLAILFGVVVGTGVLIKAIQELISGGITCQETLIATLVLAMLFGLVLGTGILIKAIQDLISGGIACQEKELGQ
jgi:hypothetical protein